jgi:hypothetical protein
MDPQERTFGIPFLKDPALEEPIGSPFMASLAGYIVIY